MGDLFTVHINIDTAQAINHAAEPLIPHGHKVRNVHIQIHIQHFYCLLGTSAGIGRITFPIIFVLSFVGTDV